MYVYISLYTIFKQNSILLYFLVWHMEVLGPGVKPEPQQGPATQQGQHQIPNPLNHKGSPQTKFYFPVSSNDIHRQIYRAFLFRESARTSLGFWLFFKWFSFFLALFLFSKSQAVCGSCRLGVRIQQETQQRLCLHGAKLFCLSSPPFS